MIAYNDNQELQMCTFFSGLSEKDKRHYAAIESQKLGRGGQAYISRLFGISPLCIRKGVRELADASLMAEIPTHKQRRQGGGRKKKK